MLRCNGVKAPPGRSLEHECPTPSLEGAPWSPPREQAAGGLRGPRPLGNSRSMTRRATAAPGRPRSTLRKRPDCRKERVSGLFWFVAVSPLSSCAWRTLTLKGMLQAKLLATPQGPGVPGSYPISAVVPGSSTIRSEKP